MASLASKPPPDPITIFLGDIPAEEYKLRSVIQTARNAASFRVNSAESKDARQLLWMCIEIATSVVYDAGATAEELKTIGQYCRRLLTVAEQAEAIFGGY